MEDLGLLLERNRLETLGGREVLSWRNSRSMGVGDKRERG